MLFKLSRYFFGIRRLAKYLAILSALSKNRNADAKTSIYNANGRIKKSEKGSGISMKAIPRDANPNEAITSKNLSITTVRKDLKYPDWDLSARYFVLINSPTLPGVTKPNANDISVYLMESAKLI